MIRTSCSGCGRLTASPSGICTRPSCINSYRRAETAAQRQEASSVYAVWFPSPQVLKIGTSDHGDNRRFVAVATNRARRRDWKIEGRDCIWKEPGDMRVEAWIQATLAFRWQMAIVQKIPKICEWFSVADLSRPEIIDVLDETYKLVPADHVEAITIPGMAALAEENEQQQAADKDLPTLWLLAGCTAESGLK